MEIYAYEFIAEKKVEETTVKIQKIEEVRILHQSEEKKLRLQKEEEEVQYQVEALPAQNIVTNTNIEEKETESLPLLSFVKPIKGGVTTSGFGDKISRIAAHQGHDWAVPVGTRVTAAEGGMVELAYYSESYGYNVLINHGNGFQTRYAHLSKLKVTPGQWVWKGKLIGLSGSTGDSTGPHLHFEMIQNHVRVNPLPFLK